VTRAPRESCRARVRRPHSHKAKLSIRRLLSYGCIKAHRARLLFKDSDFSHTEIAKA